MKPLHFAHLALAGLLAGSLVQPTSAQSAEPKQQAPQVAPPAEPSPPAEPPAPAEPAHPRLKLPRARVEADGREGLVARPRLGVTIEASDEGLVVHEVEPDSLAARAGVQSGDILLSLGGRRIAGADDIRAVLEHTPPGEMLGLSVVREGSGLVKLEASMPAARQAPGAPAPDGQMGGFLGVQLGEAADSGVTVAGVVEQSAAWFAGLEQGDVLKSIDDRALQGGDDVVGAIASKEPGSFVKLEYERLGEMHSVRVRLGSRAASPGALGNFMFDQMPMLRGGPGPMMMPRGQGGAFVVPGGPGGAQFFSLDDDDLDPFFHWFDQQGNGFQGAPHVFRFDGDGTFDSSPDDGGDEPMVFDLDDLGDARSLSLRIEDGVLTIDRDGQVQEIPLGQLHDGDAPPGVPQRILRRLAPLLHGDGHHKFQLQMQRSDDEADAPQAAPRVRAMNFQAPRVRSQAGTHVDQASATTTPDAGCTDGVRPPCCQHPDAAQDAPAGSPHH